MKLAAYLDFHDVQQGNFETTTIPLLQRAGITIPLVPVQGLPFQGSNAPVTPTLTIGRFVAICARLRELGMDPIGWSFPAVDGDLLEARQLLSACTAAAGVRGQGDLEPHGGAHWTPALALPWIEAGFSITTTRAELPHVGSLPDTCELWLQLEQPDSTDSLEAALAIAARWANLDLVVPVIGLFDMKGLVRTPKLVRRDCDRCAPQARRPQILCAWSAHTLTPPKADVLSGWLAEQRAAA